MADRGTTESPDGGGKELGSGDSRSADLKAVAAGLAALPQPVGFPGIIEIADTLPVMIAYLDRDLRYLYLNKTLAEWLEMPRKEVLRKTFREILGDAAFEHRRPFIERAFGGDKQWFVGDLDHRTRGKLTVQSEYVPHRGPDGDVIGLIVVLQDVTEQRATELALRESEARFRRISDSSPVPMWVTRVDGSRDFVNEAFTEFFGFPPEKRGFHDWVEAIHPDDRDAFVSAQLAASRDLLPYDLVARFRRHDGQWRWLRAVAKLRSDPEGQVIGMVGAASDITEAKEAEIDLQRQVEDRTVELVQAQDQLRQAQKMEALGQLTGGIAHDFNNLLTVVVGGLDIITKQESDERLLQYATYALAAAERGARLTAQLLAFSRVQRLEVRPTFVATLIDDMRPLLRNVLGPGIEKEFKLDPDPIPVLADPTQLEVAVLNLAINARDAMPEGGKLTFCSKRVEVSDDPELEPGTYVELAIGDTGSGMPPEVAARAFEPFFTTKEVGKGTGLGLSMVYGMARQSGGTARIRSEPGEGTTVCLYFRRAPLDSEVIPGEGERDGGVAHRPGPVRILVIDDDDEVRRFISAGLEEFGHEVTEAADGVEGVRRFDDILPDLVILDYIMPGKSGAEVAADLLARKPDQPILFVSGYSETDEIRRVAPHAQILAKPFRATALEEAVRAVLAAD
ncbi:hybrid sensor histidine kinase/response regulator [Sphingomonas xanthus]|uniref:histidine kinase n=1 Tax=Sphingomonas xanthus TaxID=2594473 RepID=A0A516IS34_9SPHN|nr:PAS domain-containing sensor histidine kinase [Sphingomonas xanthus]QDP19722.1 PAS domain S-box protein [Sphingomonas xanthus]